MASLSRIESALRRFERGNLTERDMMLLRKFGATFTDSTARINTAVASNALGIPIRIVEARLYPDSHPIAGMRSLGEFASNDSAFTLRQGARHRRVGRGRNIGSKLSGRSG